MINITVTEEGIPLVWSSEDWLKLREEHRIVGNLVGSLASKPNQENFKGLPLALLPEEATLLKEKEIARLVKYSSLQRVPTKKVKKAFEKYRQTVCEEQIECLVEERKRQIAEKLDYIVQGKQRKLMGLKTKKKKTKTTEAEQELSANSVTKSTFLDRNEVLEEELKKIRPPSKSSSCIQIFTTYPWLKDEDATVVAWKYPMTPTEILRYSVFKNFWEKGYYVTCGQKFGGDFLVYPGDPFKFHAYFLVVCIDRNAPIRPVDMATLGRLGTSVRKSVVFACEGSGKEICFQTLKWSGLKDL